MLGNRGREWVPVGIFGGCWQILPLLGRDLARKDRNGASDPFVRLRYNGKVQESTVSTTSVCRDPSTCQPRR